MWPEPIHLRGATLDGARTYVMGVVNATPDSFSDGGRFLDAGVARERALELAGQGADLIDLGGESTRPGAEPVDAAAEWARVEPVLRALRHAAVPPISIDTYKAEVAERALDEGAQVINDVSGGALDPRILDVAARAGAPVILGHLRGTPRTMMEHAHYLDVFEEVVQELATTLARARAAGVTRIIADPGIGFGKRGAHNLVLLARAGDIARRLGVPVMIGPSRKAFLGALTGLPATQRGPATIAAVVGAALGGAHLVRVHDVAEARQALLVADALAGVRATGGSPQASERRQPRPEEVSSSTRPPGGGTGEKESTE